MRFTSKQVTAMVVAISAAVVLAPVGVMAATGQLVNIVDPVLGARKVRVGSAGTLQVESRAGATSGAFSKQVSKVTDVVLHVVHETTAPNRIAVTEATYTVRGTVTGARNNVDILGFIENKTLGYPCGHPTGWTKYVLRSVSLHQGATQQLLFNGPPLVLPAAPAGRKVCLGVHQTTWVGGTELDVGLTGMVFQ